ncbi:CDP-alcohol phosphatidyltransferase family protein, partial [Anaplasma marginale]|uniref:CDP-alcohol phosphatidyltransferase family protein n=1 Tax=Anaplasma marginale TaxID=770 RepID=UPI0005B35AD6
MKRVYLLPNLITTGNLFCGFYSIIASIHYEFVLAAWVMIAATVFDLLDGRIARLAKATS